MLKTQIKIKINVQENEKRNVYSGTQSFFKHCRSILDYIAQDFIEEVIITNKKLNLKYVYST